MKTIHEQTLAGRRLHPDAKAPVASSQHLPALTSIRGIAAICVIFYHFRDSYPGQSGWLDWFARGSLGVDLFFVLSGFILAHVYRHMSGQAPTRQVWRDFIVARLARVYPLHLVTLLAMLGLVLAWPAFAARYANYTSAWSFLLNLGLLQNWGFTRVSWNIPSWSISAEWLMYLLFPLLAMPRFWKAASAAKLLLLMGTIVVAQIALVLAKGWSDYGGMSLGGMTRVIFEFVLGYAAWHFYDRLGPRASATFNLAQIAIACGFVACVLLPSMWLLFVPFATALICTLSNRDAIVSEALAARTLVYLGDISYSLYMWHWLILNAANTADLPGLLDLGEHSVGVAIFLQLTLILAMAAMSFRFIEQPCRKALVRLAAFRQPAGTR